MRRRALEAQGMIEYGLVIGFVALVAMAGFVLLGESMTDAHHTIFTRVAESFGL